MPYTAFSRMKDEIAVGFIIAIFTTFFAVIVPNYQKYAYENTEAKRYSEYENNAGYPAAEGFPTVNSLADIDEAKNRNFTITLDVSKLTPLDFYMDIVGRTSQWGAGMGVLGRYQYKSAGGRNSDITHRCT